MRTGNIGVIIVLAWSWLLAACGPGLDEHLKKRASVLGEEFKSAETYIGQKRQEFDSLSQGPEAGFLKPYIAAEKLSAGFERAQSMLKVAQTQFGETRELIKTNKPEANTAVQTRLKQVEKGIGDARNEAAISVARLPFLIKARDSKTQLLKETQSKAATAAGIKTQLSAFVTGYQQKYKQRQDLKPQLQKVLASHDQIQAARAKVEAQAKAAQPDFALIGDSHQASNVLLARLSEDDKALRAHMTELDASSSKTLIDMMVKYYVTIGRSSWNNSSDYEYENDFKYDPIEISLAQYEQLDAADPEADPRQAFKEIWKTLKINMQYNIGYDDGMVFYIADLPLRFFHKYRLNQSGKLSETDWVEVNQQTFGQHEGDLGMDLSAKPVGLFENEAITSASPPGMAYVGNPAYGSWQGSNWVFLSSYGGYPSYSRAEFDDWGGHYRGRKAYYGKKDKKGYYYYGSGGGYTSAFYGKSNYSRSGGYGDMSIRGAGPGRRGGGPGGGGK